MNARRLLVILSGMLVSLSFAANGPAGEPVATAESVTRAIADAEAARQKAAALGAEWLETRDLVEQAERAGERGDWADALDFANRARQQGELAAEQAQREAKAWTDRVVR